jgi:oxaloacetate decarboxylase (Na+ extruding) subunit alpha
VTELWDTTLRLLSQEPLARHVGTARLLDLASVLDRAGFACLEVSGGGCFDWAVAGGVESPWERIRAIAARCSTPLGMALRGRFLVGSRPLDADLVRRFVWSAAESGVDVFRIHDPLNDVAGLVDAASAVREARKELVVGLVHNPGPTGEDPELLERAGRVAGLGASRIVVEDPAGSLDAAHARSVIERVREATGLEVGLYCQGAAGRALAAALEGARGGGSPIACTIYPVAMTLYRPSAEALAQSLGGIGLSSGVDVAILWEACELVDEELGDMPVPPLSPRDAVRAAEHGLSAPLVAQLDDRLRSFGQSDRLDEVLDELGRVRIECGWPPLNEPVGAMLGSQALLHVLSAQRWHAVVDEVRLLVAGAYGMPPRPVDPVVRRAVELLGDEKLRAAAPQELDTVREAAAGLATSEEELLLLALFDEEAEPLLRTIRARGRGEGIVGRGVGETQAARVRELVDLVQESGIGEVTIEEGEMRITVRRSEEPAPATPAVDQASIAGEADSSEGAAELPVRNGLVRVESPMVGVFYRAADPAAPPLVAVGDTVERGQTLCLLEAMKLFNEVKAELDAVVRAIHVENATPVEYGQLLFELEPIDGSPPAGL